MSWHDEEPLFSTIGVIEYPFLLVNLIFLRFCRIYNIWVYNNFACRFADGIRIFRSYACIGMTADRSTIQLDAYHSRIGSYNYPSKFVVFTRLSSLSTSQISDSLRVFFYVFRSARNISW